MKRSGGGRAGFIPMTLFYAGAIIIAAIALTIAAEGLLRRAPKAPSPASGLLDLRAWDFAASGPVALGGEWLFVPDRLLKGEEFESAAAGSIVSRTVPDTRFSFSKAGSSGSGSGTYRLSILLPASVRGLAIRYSTVWTAFELEANGVIVARAGHPDMEASSARPSVGAAIARVDAPGGRLELIVRVSNHEYRWGGISRPFILGDEARLNVQKRGDDMRAYLIVGALLGVAFNASFIFAFRRRERAYLYFAFFALLVALRELTTGDILLSIPLPGIGFGFLVRLQYVSIFLLIPACALFFYRLFSEDISRFEMVGFVAPSLAFGLLLPFAPLVALTWSVLPYAIIALVSASYGYVAICLRPARRRRPGSGIVLAAGTLLLATVIANLRYGVFVARGEGIFPIGLAAFVIVQTLVLAKRFTRAFESAEELTSDLASTNARLVEEARSANDARRKLEAALAEKEILLQEVHHRVKNSLQIVMSIINLQAHRTKDPAVLAAYQSVRDRIRAISSVHARLFGLESEKRIDIRGYAEDLIKQFRESYAEEKADIILASDPIEVPMDLCIELGLMLTELVINAYRYAVIPAGGGPIRVEFRREGDGIVLSVGDDGPGFPALFAPNDTQTIGFKIVSSLAKQRGGSVTVASGPGPVVRVHIPLPPPAPI